MRWNQRIGQGLRNYVTQTRQFSRNVKLLLLASVLTNFGIGVFSVDFNLYILSTGIKADALGGLLSVAPVAHLLAAIPIGFFAERVGFRKAFLVIYAVAGISLLAQVATQEVAIIAMAAFVQGLAFTGDFVVRLPFLSANAGDSHRTVVFSMDSFLSGLAYAVGSIVAGFLPNLFTALGFDLVQSYRYTLFASGAFTILSLLPVLFIQDHTHLEKKKISLSPYLWGIDGFTIRAAVVEFFLGLTFGLTFPFMNVIFLYHLNTSREFFSAIEAAAFIPVMAAILLGPLLARKIGLIPSVSLGRLLAVPVLVALAFFTLPMAAVGSYWVFKALFMMTQSIWFAFVMAAATKKAKAAVSAWLEITFQLGLIISAPTAGFLIARGDYDASIFLAAGMVALAGLLSWVFMAKRERADMKQTLESV